MTTGRINQVSVVPGGGASTRARAVPRAGRARGPEPTRERPRGYVQRVVYLYLRTGFRARRGALEQTSAPRPTPPPTPRPQVDALKRQDSGGARPGISNRLTKFLPRARWSRPPRSQRLSKQRARGEAVPRGALRPRVATARPMPSGIYWRGAGCWECGSPPTLLTE